jgi:hypothetical protein
MHGSENVKFASSQQAKQTYQYKNTKKKTVTQKKGIIKQTGKKD